jgi:hypothetical protein
VSATDLLVAVMILAVTMTVLYRSLGRAKGPCHGCGGCSSRRDKTQPLVTLGARGRARSG